MKVTCSILCYNYGRYLAQAIESCINQLSGNYELEIIVIDDGSIDETPAVCHRYRNYIRTIRTENLGFGASLDRAMTEASGDYVCLLDADDYFTPDKIVKILPFMEQGCLFIQHDKYFMSEDGTIDNTVLQEGGNTSTLCIHRSAALTLLPVLNENYFHALSFAGHICKISEPLALYRRHQSSMMNNRPRDQWLLHHASVTHALADHLSLLSEHDCTWTDRKTLAKIGKEFRAVAFYDEVEAALYLGQKTVARKIAIKMLFSALQGVRGLEMWRVKVAARGILGKTNTRQ